MVPLIYTTIASLDGYVADAQGNFDWAAPDEEVHAFVNDLERTVGTYLCGRRLYEVMRFWETASTGAHEPPVFRDYALIWRAADKVVYSTTLESPSTPRTRVERRFDPEAVSELKATAARALSIGGPTLAGQAIAAGLVDEIRLLIAPVLVGAGTSAFPVGIRLELELLDERRFTNGFAYLRYAVAPNG